MPTETESEFPLRNMYLVYPQWFSDATHFVTFSRHGKNLLFLDKWMRTPRNYSYAFRVCSLLIICVPLGWTLRHTVIKIWSGKLVLNHYLICQLIYLCQRFTPIPFAVDIYPLVHSKVFFHKCWSKHKTEWQSVFCKSHTLVCSSYKTVWGFWTFEPESVWPVSSWRLCCTLTERVSGFTSGPLTSINWNRSF